MTLGDLRKSNSVYFGTDVISIACKNPGGGGLTSIYLTHFDRSDDNSNPY